jgi:ubiquitin-protein ligase
MWCAKGGRSGGNSAQAKLTRRRLLKEFKDIKASGLSMVDSPFNGTDEEMGVRLYPTSNILEWHFSFLGAPDSVYEQGVYHGRILLPKDYPRRAPQIAICTPNGRWEVNKFICLSATAFHQETWDSSWNLRTLVMALRGHMLTSPVEIGAISTNLEHRRTLADLSRDYQCPMCRVRHCDLLDPTYGFGEGADMDEEAAVCKRGQGGGGGVATTGAGALTHSIMAPPMQQRRRRRQRRHMDHKLTNRVIAKEMRLHVVDEERRVLARRQRHKLVRQVFIFLASIFMSKFINSMGGKSFVSFSVTV